MCHLYDYGVDGSYFWMTMKYYRASLKQWRLRQTKSLSENLLLYLNIYNQVYRAYILSLLLFFFLQCKFTLG